MLQNVKNNEKKLHIKIFVITSLIFIVACMITYMLLIFATPLQYKNDESAELDNEIRSISSSLHVVGFKEGKQELKKFAKENELDIILYDSGQKEIFKALYNNENWVNKFSKTICSSGAQTKIKFKDSNEDYTLSITHTLKGVNNTIQAMERTFPLLIFVVVLSAFITAFFYSRYVLRLQRVISREKELEKQQMELFSAASHELKTPITILKGHLNGMLDGIGDYQDKEKYIVRSLDVTNRMEHLVQEILMLTKMKNAELELSMSEINISEILEEQTELAQEMAELKNQKVSTNIANNIFANGEKKLLKKAIGNVLSNAVKYSPEEADIVITLDEKGVLTVTNSGTHLSEEVLSHMFDPFYTADPSHNSKSGGSGLGLYLVHTILDKHNIKYSVESENNNVKFTVYFIL